LLWNERRTEGTPFLPNTSNLLLEYGRTAEVRHERTSDTIGDFFAPTPYELETFRTRQVFDYAALRGACSSSYLPAQSDPGAEPLRRSLCSLFSRHEVGDRVAFDYDTKVFFGDCLTAFLGQRCGRVPEYSWDSLRPDGEGSASLWHDEQFSPPRRGPLEGSLSAPKSFHMIRRTFAATAMRDRLIADYYGRVETLPVLSQVKPGEIRAALPSNAPLQGEGSMPFSQMWKS